MRTYLSLNKLVILIHVTTCLLVCGCAAEKDDAVQKDSSSLPVVKSSSKSEIPGIDSIRDELDSVRLELEETRTDLATADASIRDLEKLAVEKDVEIEKLKTSIASETAKLRLIYDSLHDLSGGEPLETDAITKSTKEEDQSSKKVALDKEKKPGIDTSSSDKKTVLGPEPPQKRKP